MYHFDIGLCRVYYGKHVFGGYREFKTEEFEDDVTDKTMTIFTKNQDDKQLRYCIEKHLPKMLGYYSDYRVMINSED